MTPTLFLQTISVDDEIEANDSGIKGEVRRFKMTSDFVEEITNIFVLNK